MKKCWERNGTGTQNESEFGNEKERDEKFHSLPISGLTKNKIAKTKHNHVIT